MSFSLRRLAVLALLVGFAWARQRKLTAGEAPPADASLDPYSYKDIAWAPNATTTSIAPTATPVLECFQVDDPVLTPAGITPQGASLPIDTQTALKGSSTSCTETLMVYSFANSYNAPFVGNYTPPDCDFDQVVMNFTAVVAGRQYDRTGVMYLGDTEVWRTSTAEPTSYGIRWVWLKDMTPFTSLWKQPQTVIFDLPNIVDSTYTGIINTTLTATFFKAETGDPPPADLIIPISERLGSSGQPSQFTTPPQNATNTVAFPRNANRAVFTVDVKGQGNEEFWWSNVPQSAIYTFNSTYGVYPGYSPFREVQVLVDGSLAGVYWPFPVIYTGGIVPELNRPIVGVQTFDIKEHEIDISPWLPLLCDGNDHTFTINIVGLNDNGHSQAWLANTTSDEWYITGKVFVWLDDANSTTTGILGNFSTSSPEIDFSQTITQNATGANETIDYTLAVSRAISISSFVRTQHTAGTSKWTQLLSYSNVGGVFNYGDDNLNDFLIAGDESASARGAPYYATRYSFPLYANSSETILPAGNLTLNAEVDQGETIEIRGHGVFPTGLEPYVAAAGSSPGGGEFEGSVVSTWRNGTATYYAPADNSYSTGSGQTRQVFSFDGILAGGGGTTQQLYYRDVSAANDTVTHDLVEGA
ncbi:peptide N-acetyl-beta-D-glucosaminyl asparaginase amidase A-domain-containing protein [Xylariaceae sp. FL0804]|nr:peptide N-acetyl-beta-D-glucosaminyl asparaginase amidase A-domain-containing protein [Xylariaceae sp. FL0804]